MKIFLKTIFSLLLCLVAWSGSAAVANDSLNVKKKLDSLFAIQTRQAAQVGDDDFYADGPIEGSIADSTQHYIDKARAVLAQVRQAQNFISNLNDASSFNLPVGISRTIAGITYDIAIHAIRLRPTHAEVDVFMQFEVPQNGKTLTFMADSIKFTKAGGIVGDATLRLLGEFAINFSGDKVQLLLKSRSATSAGTFVRMDCDGFKEMGLDAEVRFSRDILIPENATGTKLPGNVTADFQATMTSWNDLIVQLNVPAFQIAGVDGLGVSVSEAVFDFSDLRNAPNVVFPENYNPDYTTPALANLWRGVYLREVSIRLPPEFKNKNSTRTAFTGYDLLIDNQGFTGKVKGTNIMNLQSGDMNGWAFSLDSIRAEFQRSSLVEATFNGNIVVSVSNEQTPLKYSAVMSAGGNYLFNIAPARNLDFTVFGAAKVEIHHSSFIEVRVQDKTFRPKAVLTGSMSIEAKLSEGGQGVSFANINFQNLEVQTVKPYIKVGAFSFGSEALQQKMAGFPISINNIGLRNITDQDVGLDFDLLLNLTGGGGGAFAADAGLTIIGSLKSESGRQRWRFKEVQVRSIAVDINGGAFKINGSLTFYRNDLLYGDGFNGQVNAEFTPGIKVSATAIFGNVTGNRYWYADAMATFSPGILIFPGVAFYGFGGGAYYGMKMDTEGLGSTLGQTASGVVYVPDERSGLGLKAILNIGSAPTDQAFNGDITFEVAFFRGGGIRTISLTGNAFIATPKLDDRLGKLTESVGKLADQFETLEAQANAATGGMAARINDQESMIQSIHGSVGSAAGSRGAISARAFIQYDFENRVLHGNFNVSINAGGGLLTGSGDAVLHFAPHEWYVYVGTPEQRIYLSMGIGPIRATTTSYFMVGSKILGSPPPPPEVSEILGGVDLDYMKDLNAIGTGAGFAFGSAFDVNTGDLTFLMFYARFHAGAGFDIMVKNYGNSYCAGSNERIGINGWYANGQMYAFFEGAIGIRVKVFGVKKRIEILSIGAAAVLQAKLPNPFWMRGIVGGRFSVLGGAVKGDCKFEVVLGQECVIQRRSDGSALEGITVISQLTPANGEQEVNVFNTPQVVFNMAVEKEFSLMEDGRPKYFRIRLDYFKLMSDNISLQGELQWNINQDVLVFNSYEVLPARKTIKAMVQLSFEEKVSGSWQKVRDNGQAMIEKSEISFVTGEAPDFIPLSNVEYSYPIIGQTYFYKDEAPEGYIRLKRGQSYLFSPTDEWKQIGRMTDAAGEKVEYDFTHRSGTITFPIPGARLKNSQAYAVELINVPRASSSSVDRNVSTATTQVAVEGQTLDTEITTNVAQGSIEDLQEKSIFTMEMRSSMYARLADKVNGLTFTSARLWDQLPGVPEMWTELSGPEYFHETEMPGSNYEQTKLVRLEADFTDNTWYNTWINPLIYEGYPINGVVKLRRVAEPMGIPPSRALYLAQGKLVYNLPMEMHADFQQLRAVCANLSLTYVNARTTRLLTTTVFPYPKHGDYKVKFKYVLPGVDRISSETIKPFKYEFILVR
jgi:hypothetical protein